METDGDNAFVFPLLELPAPCFRSVLLHLWLDVRDAASLSCCCKATAEACNDDQIWKELLMRRFGAGALPCEKPPAGRCLKVDCVYCSFLLGAAVLSHTMKPQPGNLCILLQLLHNSFYSDIIGCRTALDAKMHAMSMSIVDEPSWQPSLQHDMLQH